MKTKLKILTVPHEMLYRKADPVGRIDSEIQDIINRMFFTMHKHKGIGLAAPQVGIPLQIVIIQIKWLAEVFINPIIVDVDDEWIPLNENCLSIPNFTVSIKRASQVFVKSLNRFGKKQDFEATGLLARCLQHEIDHLRGILINDKEK
jgi:peptide deformylase